jgi:KDO2-lipid IV(A) lauroyltransferase
MFKKIYYLIQAVFIYLFFFIGRILGIKISRKIFSVIFLKLGPLFKSKKIIKKNLKIYSQNISNFDEKRIINGMWKNFGMTFIEYIHLDKLRRFSTIEINGEKNLENLIKSNKPVIFVSGHFSNFELMSMAITKKQIPLATIYRPLNNLFLNPFMEHLRKKFICKNQIKKGINGVRDAIEFIKKNHSIALMIDQRVSEGEKINFFGKPAFTTTLPAQLSLKYDLGIIPVFIERINDERFKIQFHEEINPKNFKNKIELTKKLNEILEKMIIKNPTQWIWSHNRWK